MELTDVAVTPAESTTAEYGFSASLGFERCRRAGAVKGADSRGDDTELDAAREQFARRLRHGADSRGGGVDLDERWDLVSLSHDELVERMTELGRERCRVEAQLAEVSAELSRRSGGRGAAALMRERLNVSARQATAETALAESLVSEFPATLDALRSGEINVGHARVIARVGNDAEHADEPSLLEMARGYPVDMFARMTRQYMSCQDSTAAHQRQHENRWASMVQDPDGSWRLAAYFGYDVGKRISSVFERMTRSMRNSANDTGTSPRQRRADALRQLILGDGPERVPEPTLLIIADYDSLTHQLRNLRYDDGTAVPADQLARLAAKAKIVPAIFDNDGEPLWLGRAQRRTSDAQRTALCARDGGCVICAAVTDKCQPHHIEWYTHGGPTDIDNLVLLCERCHHLIHDDNWQLQHAGNHYKLKPPNSPPISPPHARTQQRTR